MRQNRQPDVATNAAATAKTARDRGHGANITFAEGGAGSVSFYLSTRRAASGN